MYIHVIVIEAVIQSVRTRMPMSASTRGWLSHHSLVFLHFFDIVLSLHCSLSRHVTFHRIVSQDTKMNIKKTYIHLWG